MRIASVALALLLAHLAGRLGSPREGGATAQDEDHTGCESAFRLVREPSAGVYDVVGEGAPVPLDGVTYEVWRDHAQSEVARGSLSESSAVVRVVDGGDGVGPGDRVEVAGEAVAVILRADDVLVATDVLCN